MIPARREESSLAAAGTAVGLLCLAACIVGYGIAHAAIFSLPARFFGLGVIVGVLAVKLL